MSIWTNKLIFSYREKHMVVQCMTTLSSTEPSSRTATPAKKRTEISDSSFMDNIKLFGWYVYLFAFFNRLTSGDTTFPPHTYECTKYIYHVHECKYLNNTNVSVGWKYAIFRQRILKLTIFSKSVIVTAKMCVKYHVYSHDFK